MAVAGLPPRPRTVVGGLPHPDGRYRHERLDEHPGQGRAGYLAWAPHPNTGDEAPVGFALVTGLDSARHALTALFVVPAARGRGVGGGLAREVVGRHPGAWEVAFQHDNHDAARFWRTLAREVWGEGWLEERRHVPGRPNVPPDHWISTA